LKLEKIKHGFKTLAECGGIRGVDDTSSLKDGRPVENVLCL
jgi:hypothetical protein